MSGDFRKRLRLRLDPERYRQLKLKLLERDGWKCQHCCRCDQLQIHHIIRRSQLGADGEENLIVLEQLSFLVYTLSMATRKAPRYPSEQPVVVRWSNGGVHEVLGETRDVSEAGFFFYAEFEPKEGSLVEVGMTLPPDVTGTNGKHVLCRGKVVRVEPAGDNKHGIAIEMDSYEIIGES